MLNNSPKWVHFLDIIANRSKKNPRKFAFFLFVVIITSEVYFINLAMANKGINSPRKSTNTQKNQTEFVKEATS